jgi:hypothetical protein
VERDRRILDTIICFRIGIIVSGAHQPQPK